MFITPGRIIGALVDLLFPQRCIGCQREGSLLCSACSSKASHLRPPICPHCGTAWSGPGLCYTCLVHPLKLEGLRSVFFFEGVVRQSIHLFKYNHLRALAAPLAVAMSEYLDKTDIPGEVLVPVPLHRRRLRERGYNQSALLAKELGRLVNLYVEDDCLIKQRDTPAQARTTAAAERRRNVAGAFACVDNRLKGKSVILIDDVATTGATLEAAAKALHKSGTQTVWALTLAREIKTPDS